MICISSLDGAGGDEVGRLVADRVGLRLIDEEIVARAAREAGVASHVVADAEERKPLVARVLKQVLTGSPGGHSALGALHESSHIRGIAGSHERSER